MGNEPDLRDIINAGEFDPEDVEDAVPTEEKNEENKKGFDLDADAPILGSFLESAVDRMLRRSRGEEKPVPLPPAFGGNVAEALNGGLWPGLYVLVGNTGSGKSQWALQACLHAATQQIPCLYVGLELGREDLAARLLGMAAERKWSRLWLGKDAEELKAVASEHGPKLLSLPIHTAVASPYGWPYTELLPAAKAIKEKHNELLTDDQGHPRRPMLVVVDFLQLVASPLGIREDMRQRIQQTAYAARAVARDLNAAVILVSSTARDHYASLEGREEGKQPWQQSATFLVGLGKESGEVEYAADNVLILAREQWQGTQPPEDGSTVHLGVAKARAGKPGAWYPMKFDGGQFQEKSSAKKTVRV